MGAQEAREMPRYKCHKQVWALKIKSIELHRPTIEQLDAILNNTSAEPIYVATIVPEDEGYGPFGIERDYLQKHNPQAGGYYVVYGDGYKSFSPEKAFEEGYTRL